MPSPIGHALAGIACGWGIEATTEGRRAPARRMTLAFALLGMAPDLDLLTHTHRGPTHSLGAACLVGLAAWLVLRARVARPTAAALACTAAYGSHILLDWLGADTWAPFGITALWPISGAYYQSPWTVFLSVSRQFSRPELFWKPNILALLREIAILGPPVALLWLWRRARTRQALPVLLAVVAAVTGAAPAHAQPRRSTADGYAVALQRYEAGDFDRAVAALLAMPRAPAVPGMPGVPASDDARKRACAVMLNTEAALAVSFDAPRSRALLDHAHALLLQGGNAVASEELRRGWYLLVSAALQANRSLSLAQQYLAEALEAFPLDPDILVASAAVFETRASAEAPGDPDLPATAGTRSRPDAVSRSDDHDGRRLLERARSHLASAVEADPQHDEARLRLGRVLYRLDRPEQAIEQLQLVRTRTADRGLKYLATVFQAAVESALDDGGAAASLYGEAIGEFEGQSAFVGLSEAYYRQGRTLDAAAALQQALAHADAVDPWSAYLTGDGWHLKARLAAMRAVATQARE